MLDDMARAERGKRRLLGRRLYRELSTMREFLNLGLESAIIRVPSKKAATNQRTRFYFARRQEAILASAAQARDSEGAQQRIDLAEELYQLVFELDEDDRGLYLRMSKSAGIELEPDPKGESR